MVVNTQRKATPAQPSPPGSSLETRRVSIGTNAPAPQSILTPAEAAELRAPLTRREFLNYALLASLGLFFVTLGGITFLFALPRFGPGDFGGDFDLGTAQNVVPLTSDPPLPNTAARIWLVNLDAQSGNGKPGVLALYNVCVHLGCLYAWQPVTNRFECPCHGSKYQKDGTYIEGPAPRNLDRMAIRFVDANGKVLAQTNATGNPLPVPDPNAGLVVETGKIILGKTHG